MSIKSLSLQLPLQNVSIKLKMKHMQKMFKFLLKKIEKH